MTEQKMIRLAFVGLGCMGQCAHLRNYASLPGCQVAAAAEIRPRTAERVAAKYGIPALYDNLHEMMKKDAPDAVVCCQPFQRHALLLPELLPYGKPIFIEKPLAGSLEAGEALWAAIDRAESWVMVGYHKRSDPAVMHACDLIQKFKESGEIGKMRYVRLLMPAGDWIAGGFWDYVDAGDPQPTMALEAPPSDLDAAGYDEYVRFVNYYIHQINLLRRLLGESYRAAYMDPSGVLMAAQSNSGIAASIEMSPYQTTVDWQESALIAFERGYVKVELPAPGAVNRPGRVEVLRDPGNGATPMMYSPHLPWVHAMRRQAELFVAAVRGEVPIPCDASEALEDLRVARDCLRLWQHI